VIAAGRISRGLGSVGIVGAFVVGLVSAHGCVDDRAKVANAVFFCDPSSRTADADCGKGFMCYGATQSVGGSICVPECDPADPATCPQGVCTQSGACLTRCTVPAQDAADPCPAPLVCSRTTISPLDAMAGNDGVCLPINASCAKTADCRSPVFNDCTSTVNGAEQGGEGRLIATGEVCVQGRCEANGVACEPGSACIKGILPASIPAPDVCTPVCTPARDRVAGQTFNECMPGLTCLSDAFPQTDAPACVPGFPGWLCVDNLGCTAGGCDDWQDVDPALSGFKTCSPPCKTDDDCVPYDRGTPNFMTHNTCHAGKCRNLQSMFFPLTCLGEARGCALDSEAKCVEPSPTGTNDMGASMVPTLGLGAFGGQAAVCVHGCSARDDCAPLAAKLRIPMTCGVIEGMPACVPVVPYATQCRDNGDCYGGLTCEQDPLGDSVCTKRCTSNADCTGSAALGSAFACSNNLCTPLLASGKPATMADACLSGQILKNQCVSPKGWACSSDAECANGQCTILQNTNPPFGRCN
jgi:hypothetical protein